MRSLHNIALIFSFIVITKSDQKCRERDLGIEGRSITRDPPDASSYVAYTTTRAGKRFEKSNGRIQAFSRLQKELNDFNRNEENENEGPFWTRTTLVLNQNNRYQTIHGFGGSVTDAAAYNWNKLSERTKHNFISSYFGEDGLEYNLIRTPIGGADFSTHPYTYNEYPWNDAALTNFTFTYEDLFLKIPMIKYIQRVSKQEVKVMASTWSPPVWMKTNEHITGFSQLKPEFYQSFADYHVKFMELYEKAEIDIWALTTTNEPINGIIPFVTFNSLGWFPAEMMENADSDSIKYIDGIAVHYYGNFAPATIFDELQNRYNKILLATEACEGPMPWDVMRVKLGSWERAHRYTKNIIEDLNHHVTGWIDWNLCLDERGGPNWAYNFVDAPIMVIPERDEFIKQPMFYAMGHFSKFIPRGSQRISVTYPFLEFGRIDNVAFRTPQGNIVLVLHNSNTFEMDVRINVDAIRHITIKVEAESIITMEINTRLF
ncbi:lysosomal acid glucosylceramidase isoform X2 [Pieris rapae]|uniref:lysosomal acid glucosylceramidase isoform X2 n=1 Tax=Pieris rapae TaxID=64459 RepID=UPI001E27D901|nr:lysosomal acid glucosylceramidase isoform X2 [Pieris rapae]